MPILIQRYNNNGSSSLITVLSLTSVLSLSLNRDRIAQIALETGTGTAGASAVGKWDAGQFRLLDFVEVLMPYQAGTLTAR